VSGPGRGAEARIADIDRTRARLGIVALLCAVAAVGMAAMGLAAAAPGRPIAFGLLAVGGLMVVLRLRLAWQRVQLARMIASSPKTPEQTP
jgi:xanthine/uracil/vitamin C permease (AzgA family)